MLILNHSSVASFIFKEFTDLETKSATYTLEKFIQSKNFGFNKFVISLDLDTFDRDNSISPCHCADLCFIVEDCGHILIENFRIINNKKLKRDQNID